ncbi:valine--tRNA ligase [Anaerolineales bacterium]
MTEAMPKNFDHKEAENRIYDWWEKQGYFKPEIAAEDAESFVISMPPPNVTGALHIGHALFASLEDLMIRYERMRGKAALWVPGTDHAGIATQLQVEKQLRAEGSSRHEIGREAFLKRTWQWKEEKGGTIIEQLRRIGASCDWDRARFTLDEGLSDAVQDVFIRLWEEGLIYRGPRLVNWSPGLQTAVSDLEVDHTEEQGHLYYFKYPLKDGDFLPVATTRPETILGDMAVCVHPDDPRYQHLIGKTALVPILNREIPVIADTYVDMEFGTGALKITPGHDFNDYQIGLRHELEMLSVLNRDATINDNGGKYAGLDRFEARKALWSDMEAAGLVMEVKPHTLSVPRSQRGGEIVEPLLSDQWFVKIQPLAEKALEAVRSGEIKIIPERFTKVYYHWLENIQDWCVSRQLWWGHRIPAWYREKEGDPYGEIYVGRVAPEGDGWVMEEDVLDTWFSSGLWPFSTLGWPEQTPDLQRFYPTDVLETGHDILFFWVARMIMMGIWFTGEVPFHTVYLHGLIRDKHGRKISKTLGNTIDPLDLIDQYGADPLRFTLLTSGTPGNDINLDPAKVEHTWRFVNKIWQITTFINMNLEEDLVIGLADLSKLDLPSRWVLSRLNRLIGNVQRLFDVAQYGEAGSQILSFLWDEFAPWTIEISKHALYEGSKEEKTHTLQVLIHVLDTALRLLHPFMPFMTEEAWRYLPHDGEALMIARWPEVNSALIDEEVESDFEVFMELVRMIRNTRKDYKVDPSKRIRALVSPGSHRQNLESYAFIFARVCNVDQLEILTDDAPAPENSAAIVYSDVSFYLPLEGMLDIEAECNRLKQEKEKIEAKIGVSEKKLSNEGFVANAPDQVIQKERELLNELKASVTQIDERLKDLC